MYISFYDNLEKDKVNLSKEVALVKKKNTLRYQGELLNPYYK